MIGFFALAVVTTGAFVNGNQLLDSCNRSTNTDIGFCIGYATGALDAAIVVQAVDSQQTVCVPAGVDAGQLRDIVKAYLQNHPENRQQAAGLLALNAMQAAFACAR